MYTNTLLYLKQRELKMFPYPGILHSKDGGCLKMAFIGKFVCIYSSSFYLSIPQSLEP